MRIKPIEKAFQLTGSNVYYRDRCAFGRGDLHYRNSGGNILHEVSFG